MPDDPRAAGRSPARWETAAVAASFLLYSAIASPVPALNEPHYLAKAKHFWNPAWCAGDLFLESANAHTVFYIVVGWLTLVLPLEAVAWIGRITSLALLAGGWTAVVRRLMPQSGAALFSAWLFLALQAIGNWSGEWVIGGVESKVYTFGLLFWAAAWALEDKPFRAAVACGLGIAFHPVVGLWSLFAVCGAVSLAWLTGRWRPVSLSRTALAILLIVLTALPGLKPIFHLLTAPVDSTTRYAGTYLQVFHRLAHHLDPMLIPPRAHWGYAALIVLWIAGTVFGPREPQWRWLHRVTLWAVIFAAAGMLVGWGPRPPNLMPGFEWRMHLLKFYPFRLADALLPMVAAWLVTAAVWKLVSTQGIRLGIGVLLCITTLLRGGQLASAERYRSSHETEWRDACLWMRDNLPKDILVHTPHFRFTYKWFAERPEYANYKDCPQDAAGIVEWNRRLLLLTRVFQEGFADEVYTWDELHTLHEDTGITHLITDRLGPMDFPPIYQNSSFRVYDLTQRTGAPSPP